MADRNERALVAAVLEPDARLALEAGRLQRLAQRRSVVAVLARIDVGLAQFADQAATADEVAPVAFLVAIGTDVDRQSRARQRQRRHDTENAIQPAAVVLRLQMAARQDVRPRPAMPPEDIADPVDRRVEARGLQLAHQPVPALHVLRTEGRAMHARAVGATDLAQGVEIVQEAGSVERQRVLHRSGAMGIVSAP